MSEGEREAEIKAIHDIIADNLNRGGATYSSVRQAAKDVLAARPASNEVREATKNLLGAAKLMPRSTPAPGGACTVHNFPIEAAYVWANDRSIKELEAALAAEPGELPWYSAEKTAAFLNAAEPGESKGDAA